MTAQERQQAAARLRQAAQLLPGELRRPLEALPQGEQAAIEELRLRVGQPLTALSGGAEKRVPGAEEPLGPQDLERVLEVATRASAHTALDKVQNGFVTVRGGHRIGLCGSAVVREGAVYNLRELSSLAIRVAREQKGVAAPVAAALRHGGGVYSTLSLSPPGLGKTTLLRDLSRTLSAGEGGPALRVGVADERGERAALWAGRPQLDVGPHTDVLDGCPKAAGLMMLLRGMNPQVLSADEITAPADAEALALAANCGVALLATAHAAGLEDLGRRPLYRRLLESGVFQRLVTIRKEGGVRRYAVSSLEGGVC